MIVIVAILGIGGYFAYQNYNKPNQIFKNTQPANQSKTANWKTYNNDNYGFEIKYPDSLEYPPFQKYNDSPVKIGPMISGITIQKLHKNGNGFADSALTAGNETGDCIADTSKMIVKDLFTTSQERQINTLTSYFYHQIKSISCSAKGNSCIYYDVYRIPHNNDCYEIAYGDIDKQVQPSETINQIISTFKFIESSTIKPFIKIISPKKGDTWQANETNTIQWTYDGIKNNFSAFISVINADTNQSCSPPGEYHISLSDKQLTINNNYGCTGKMVARLTSVGDTSTIPPYTITIWSDYFTIK